MAVAARGRRGLWRRGCKLVRIKVMNINHTGGLVPRSFLDGLSRPCTDLADHRTIVSSSSPSSSLTVPARTFPLLELRAFAPSPGPGVAQLAVSKYRPIIHPSFPPSEFMSLWHAPWHRTPSFTFSPLPSLPVGTVYDRTCERFDADPLDMATACQVIRTWKIVGERKNV